MMKPLNKSTATALLTRISNGTACEIQSITPKTATSFELRISAQDANRGFDWIDIIFTFDGVSDARLLEDNKLAHLDMTEGFSIIYEEGSIGFCLGAVTTLTRAKDSVLFIQAQSLKYEEAQFSGM